MFADRAGSKGFVQGSRPRIAAAKVLLAYFSDEKNIRQKAVPTHHRDCRPETLRGSLHRRNQALQMGAPVNLLETYGLH
jgi:hypothetical protein